MEKIRILLAGLAVVGGAIGAQAQNNTDPNFKKKTICTATINSDDEKVTFQKYLHPDHFDFVELVKNKADIDFLKRACGNSKIKCDVTIISGHFGGGFTDNKDFFLPLEDIEKLSCGGCQNVLGGADMVYLFGCNTLAGKNLDGRTPEEYYRVLIDEVGLEPAEARATVAVRYSAIGDSFFDRLRRVLKGSAVIGGFTSKAPLGEQIRPNLAGYFGSSVSDLKQDGVLEDWERREISLAFYNELNRMRAGSTDGSNQAAFAAKKRIQRNFGAIIGSGYIDVPGILNGTTEDFVAQKMCKITSSKDKLQSIADIVNTNERASVIQMLPYLMEISKKGERMNDKQEAFFRDMSANAQLRDIIAGPAGIINELSQAPEEQLNTVDLAVNLSWVMPAEQADFYQKAAVYVWNNSSGFIENPKFLKRLNSQMNLVTISEIKDSAFKGKAIWNLLKNLKSSQSEWMNFAMAKLPISLNYYIQSFKNHQGALQKSGLSEGWIEKHKNKMRDARKALDEICSITSKNAFMKASLAATLQKSQAGLEAVGAKDCLGKIR